MQGRESRHVVQVRRPRAEVGGKDQVGMAARTQHARYLSKRAKRIVDMLEHIEGHDDLKGPVGVGKRLGRPEPEGGVRAILGVGELSTARDYRFSYLEPLDGRRTTVDGVEDGAAPYPQPRSSTFRPKSVRGLSDPPKWVKKRRPS